MPMNTAPDARALRAADEEMLGLLPAAIEQAAQAVGIDGVIAFFAGYLHDDEQQERAAA